MPATQAAGATDVATAVIEVLSALLGEERALRDAVLKRDHDGLSGSVEESERLLERLHDLLPGVARAREAGELSRGGEARMARMRDQLRATARQNAVLIERAWRFDAEAMRLLAGLAQGQGTVGAPQGSGGSGYAIGRAPSYLNRSA